MIRKLKIGNLVIYIELYKEPLERIEENGE